MKKIVALITLLVLLASCSKDDIPFEDVLTGTTWRYSTNTPSGMKTYSIGFTINNNAGLSKFYDSDTGFPFNFKYKYKVAGNNITLYNFYDPDFEYPVAGGTFTSNIMTLSPIDIFDDLTLVLTRKF